MNLQNTRHDIILTNQRIILCMENHSEDQRHIVMEEIPLLLCEVHNPLRPLFPVEIFQLCRHISLLLLS